MRIAAPYNKSPAYPIDELNITWKEETVEDIKAFLEQHKTERVNLYIVSDFIDIDKILELRAVHNRLYLRIDYEHISSIDMLKKNDIKWFFSNNYPAYSYIMLEWMIKQEPSDIYISDDLCYNLDNVSQRCRENNISMRVVLNRIPSICKDAGSLYTTPIYRPQDYSYLDMYFDVAEFDCWEFDDKKERYRYSWDKFNVLYRRFIIDQKWTEDLQFLNPDLQFKIPNESLIKDFTEYKLNCKHRCIMNMSSVCSKCKRYIDLAQDMNDKNLRWTEK